MHTVHPTLGRIEVLVDDSKKFLDGGLSIGKKREALLNKAKGKYVMYLDSDETISPDYVETIVRLCQLDRDVCTFRAIAKNDHYWTIVDMSIYYENEEATPDKIVKRSAWHVCAIKRDIAQRFQFLDSNYGEDWTWMQRVLQHCYTEAKTNKVIFQYNHSSKHSEADRITNYGILTK